MIWTKRKSEHGSLRRRRRYASIQDFGPSCHWLTDICRCSSSSSRWCFHRHHDSVERPIRLKCPSRRHGQDNWLPVLVCTASCSLPEFQRLERNIVVDVSPVSDVVWAHYGEPLFERSPQTLPQPNNQYAESSKVHSKLQTQLTFHAFLLKLTDICPYLLEWLPEC